MYQIENYSNKHIHVYKIKLCNVWYAKSVLDCSYVFVLVTFKIEKELLFLSSSNRSISSLGEENSGNIVALKWILLISFQFSSKSTVWLFFSVCLFIFCFSFLNGCIAVLLPPIEVSGGSIAGSVVGVLFAAIVVAVVIVLIIRSDFSFQNKHHVSANERKHSKTF